MKRSNSKKNPLILEINTWVWLSELTKKAGQAIALYNVPPDEWNRIALEGFQYVWLMGVWKRSAEGLRIALGHEGIVSECRKALADFTPSDMSGSPYCIRQYTVDEMLGGDEGLEIARNELNMREIGLILDYVPNHVAPDHPWTKSANALFITGTEEEILEQPDDFYCTNGTIIARARDPYYPPWPDVLQLNAFSVELREKTIDSLTKIAGQCDGVRCDMAMLMANRIFRQTWGDRAGEMPDEDFWTGIIPKIKSLFPQFIFIAEVYWNMEWELQQQGFDFCYDKRLYDRLISDTPLSIRMHLQADCSYQNRLIRFIENHDEKRISSILEEPKHKAAMLALMTLPGARLIHQGQPAGKKARLPVFLTRSPEEPVNEILTQFYEKMGSLQSDDLFHEGDWALLPTSGWPGNFSCHNLLAWAWTFEQQRAVVVINYSDKPAQGMIQWIWHEHPDQQIQLNDLLHQTVYHRYTNDLNEFGLYVDLGPYDFHLLSF
jgi:hypothetical protein